MESLYVSALGLLGSLMSLRRKVDEERNRFTHGSRQTFVPEP
jgi:hypothetical protein